MYRVAAQNRGRVTARGDPGGTVIVGVQIVQPNRFLPQPSWLVPAMEILVLGVLVAANPVRIDREERWLRISGLALLVLLGLATVWSADRLVVGLIDGTLADNASTLLRSGGGVWLTNVVVFGLLYWEFDRGGPAARGLCAKAVAGLPVRADAEPGVGGPGLGTAVHGLPVPVVHQCHGVQPDRCDADVALGQGDDDGAVGDFAVAGSCWLSPGNQRSALTPRIV